MVEIWIFWMRASVPVLHIGHVITRCLGRQEYGIALANAILKEDTQGNVLDYKMYRK